ncbi:MAG: Rieske (2Fe-2S) protein [Pyrinomonadaceae bacterium]|nr:Rieske (2Fe-2S) protein [Pyrinomonadaceae bacterium]
MNSKKLDSAIEKVLKEERKSDERNVRKAVAPQQRDFPYERDGEAQVTRREFCNFLAITSTGLFLSAGAFATKAIYDASNAESLPATMIENSIDLKKGEALNFRYPTEADPAILVHTKDGGFHAYGQKCTHLACPVYFEKKNERLECPCHEGGFDVRTGNVLYGPPPRPLDKIQIEVRENGEVWAIGMTAGGQDHG